MDTVVKETILVTGGCRSGKSRFALDYANEHFQRKIFLATATAFDDEMKERIDAHKQARGPEWTTIEEPIEITNALASLNADCDIVLIDCVTLWISNMLMAGETESEILSRAEGFVDSIQRIPQSLITVTNEVGSGIVPTNAMARQFRDITGTMNQMVAACSDVVVCTIAGLPQVIKGKLRACTSP